MAKKSKKPTYGVFAQGMGLRPKYSPKEEQQIADYARGPTSPLGGKAKGSLARALAAKRKKP